MSSDNAKKIKKNINIKLNYLINILMVSNSD